jgi:hypothetical protein
MIANRQAAVNPAPEVELKVAQLTQDLRRREEIATGLRMDGHRLQREIARINHEAALTKRRLALGLVR